jgi:hypothetical protein
MYSTIKNQAPAENETESPLGLEALYGFLRLPLGPLHRLGPLNVGEWLDEGQFIELLNDRKATDRALGGLLPLMGIDVPPVSEILREWVDEWLESGRTPEGVEQPAARQFKEGDKIRLVVFEYSKRNRISLLGTSDGLKLVFDCYEENNGRPRFLGVRNEDIAREKLVFFLLSELRFKLAKCRKEDCGKYFALKHWKRTYKRGTFCSDCQRLRSLESAVKATSGDRIEAELMLCSLAAKRFSKQILRNPNWVKDGRLREGLVQYLNARIDHVDCLRAVYLSGPRNGVTGKWLSRAKNWKAIESIAKGEI